MRQLAPDEFAVRLRPDDLKGFFSKEIVVPEGIGAILFVDERYDATLPTGRHTVESGLFQAFGLKKGRKQVDLVRTNEVALEFTVPRLITKDPFFIDLDCSLLVRLRPGSESQFAVNLMSGVDVLHIGDLQAMLYGELKDSAQSWAGRRTITELADNVELKTELGYDLEASMNRTFQRHGLALSAVQVGNFRSEAKDAITNERIEVALQVSKEEAELELKKGLFDVYNREQIQKVAQENEEAAIYERRGQVWDRMRRAANSDRMAEVKTEQELADFLRGTDKEKLLKDSEMEEILKTTAATLGDNDKARAHLSRKAELERDFEQRRLELAMQGDLDHEQVKAEIGLERLRLEWSSDAELKKVDVDVERQRRQAKLMRDVEEAGENQALRLQLERQQAELEQARKEQEVELEKERQRQEMKVQELRSMHDLELDKMDKMGGLSVHGLLAVSSDAKAPFLAELAKTEALKDLDPAKIMALAAEKSPQLGQAVAELASGPTSPQQKEFYERILSEQKTAASDMRETQQQFQDTMKDMFNKALDAQAQVTSAFVGGGRGGQAQTSAPERMVVCAKCNYDSTFGTRFCPNCGERLSGG